MVAVEFMFHIHRVIIRLILCLQPIFVIPYSIFLLMPINITNAVSGQHPRGIGYIRAVLGEIQVVRFQNLKSLAEIRGATPVNLILKRDVSSPNVTEPTSTANGVKQRHIPALDSGIVWYLMPITSRKAGIAETIVPVLMNLIQ